MTRVPPEGITERDLEILALKNEVLKHITSQEEWERFIEYMRVYFHD